MPIYEYACRGCGAREEHLLPRGEVYAGTCVTCGGELRRAYSRIAVKYGGWGFTTTDKLVDDRHGPRKNFKELRERAEQISDE